MIDLMDLIKRFYPHSELKTVSISDDGNFAVDFARNPIPIEEIRKKIPEYENIIVREKAMKNLRKETEKRIRSYKKDKNGKTTEISFNEWMKKSQNFQDVKATYLAERNAIDLGIEGITLTYTKDQYKYAVYIINRKERLRGCYRDLKSKINKMPLEDLKSFDIKKDEHWVLD